MMQRICSELKFGMIRVRNRISSSDAPVYFCRKAAVPNANAPRCLHSAYNCATNAQRKPPCIQARCISAFRRAQSNDHEQPMQLSNACICGRYLAVAQRQYVSAVAMSDQPPRCPSQQLRGRGPRDHVRCVTVSYAGAAISPIAIGSQASWTASQLSCSQFIHASTLQRSRRCNHGRLYVSKAFHL